VNGGNGEAGLLGDFFTSLAEDSELYNNYLDDPLRTMRDANIPEDLINTILTGNIRRLNELFREDDTAASTFIFGTLIRL
jgi:hypothetical protein